MNTAELVVGGLCGLVIVCMFIWIGVALYMAYTKMDVMLGCLKNSSSVMSMASLRHGGPWGKLLLVGGVSGFITFPGFYLKRGSINAEDVNNFPVPLRRKLVALQWTVIGLFAALALLVAVGKSGVLK
ncbi:MULTISPECIES: hypothetical protein [unclassified Pseudomonas]|jgi:hypothetical protein|uniref:hypothetical protein n=1 Tax=unclassified Pseudomonas TaxID=196821 RepID=UPI001C467E8A|nr:MULTISPECIES: hypothetical protein [unclassified Pseudomonas]MBV7510055.1 hypothetical protein [Pseudomonas sp. PDM25]